MILTREAKMCVKEIERIACSTSYFKEESMLIFLMFVELKKKYYPETTTSLLLDI